MTKLTNGPGRGRLRRPLKLALVSTLLLFGLAAAPTSAGAKLLQASSTSSGGGLQCTVTYGAEQNVLTWPERLLQQNHPLITFYVTSRHVSDAYVPTIADDQIVSIGFGQGVTNRWADDDEENLIQGTEIVYWTSVNNGTPSRCKSAKIIPAHECDPAIAIYDTDGDGIIWGTGGDDVIIGTGGNDIIYGRGGDDIICAGGGDDQVFSGDGEDLVFGEAGNDDLRSGSDDDFVYGGTGADLIHGGLGTDYGDSGSDPGDWCVSVEDGPCRWNLMQTDVTISD